MDAPLQGFVIFVYFNVPTDVYMNEKPYFCSLKADSGAEYAQWRVSPSKPDTARHIYSNRKTQW